MRDTSGPEIKHCMAEHNITKVDHHTCGICHYMTNYYVSDGQLHFDPGCDCTGGGGWRESSFQDAAEWVNMQSIEANKIDIAKKFGVDLTLPAPEIEVEDEPHQLELDILHRWCEHFGVFASEQAVDELARMFADMRLSGGAPYVT